MTGPVVHPLTVRLHELGERTARQVLALLDQLDAGVLQLSQVPELAAVLVKLGADQAAGLAVAELVQHMAEAGVPPARLPSVAGVTAHSTLSGAETAAATVVAGPREQVAARLARLSRGAVSRAAQNAREAALQGSGLVQGWTRGVDSTSCQLCVWWWREGRVWPKTHHMPRHPGCTCVQVPKLVANLQGVSDAAYDESAERRELERRGDYLAAFGTDRRHSKE